MRALTLKEVKENYQEIKPAQFEGYDSCVGSGMVGDIPVMVYYDVDGRSVDDLENLTAKDIYGFIIQADYFCKIYE